MALAGFTLNVRNIIMSCYTAYLASGATLLCKTIKVDTIKRYLSAAAELSIPAQMVNPCLDLMGKTSVYIRNILYEARRWESMPNRREPVTKQMTEYIIEKGKRLNKTNPDNIYTSLGNWLVLGQQAGFRRKEWAQDRTHLKKYKDYQRNIDGSAAAFILKDFEFRGTNNKRIDNSKDKDIKKSKTVNIEWRYQKNLDNGQKITYAKDNKCKKHCFIEASKCIRARAKRLAVKKEDPIAVFSEIKKGKKKICYIDDKHITSLLQEAASIVYNIKDKKELSKFTAHSIRVGACVILHSQNVSTEDIKFRLRWRSDAFRMYLRNIVALAEQHMKILRKA